MVRYLADIINCTGHGQQEFKALFDNSITDILLVLYLSNSPDTRVSLAEKAQATFNTLLDFVRLGADYLLLTA
jgi:hypothetical protein